MDPVYFEQMAMPLLDQLYNFAHWLTGNQADTEDLVQETYAKALKGFQSFEAGTNLRAWMYRILRNTYLSSRTGLAAQKTAWLEDEEAARGGELAVEPATPELLLLRLEREQSVMDALGSLPVAQREILLLCEVEEMSYREIALVLGLPMGTVMSRLSRARTALRLRLRAQEGRDGDVL